MTAANHWACPLCDWTGDTDQAWHHGRTQHPAETPRHATVADMLAMIPALVAEIAATLHAPNPAATPARRPRTATGAVPTSIMGLELLAPYHRVQDDPEASLMLLLECSRICWEAADPDTRANHPQPVGADPTLATEAAWLAQLWPTAQTHIDQADYAWIDETLTRITRRLAAAVRMTKPARYLCPDCGNSMQLAATGWMLCEAGHQHPGPERLRDQWRRKPPMSTAHLAAQLHITTERIRKWHERGKLHPTRQEGRTLFWLPWDAVRCLYPAIVDAIESADQAS